MIKVNELPEGYGMFGNKGDVWGNSAHIRTSGEYETLCGTPMLSNNWAVIEKLEEIGCADCIAIYQERELGSLTEDK